MNNSGWVAIAEYGALYEAEFAAGRLESAGLTCTINQQDTVGVFGPGFAGASVRGVQLLVPADQVRAAREALDLDGPRGSK